MSTEEKDGTWWVMEEGGREGWDTVEDYKEGGMGEQRMSSGKRVGT